jgi:hypothetical protein
MPHLNFNHTPYGMIAAVGKAGHYIVEKIDAQWPFYARYAPKARFDHFKGVDGGQFMTEADALAWCEEYESQFH